MNIVRKQDYLQVCVWPGTLINGQIKEFEEFIFDELKTRIQYLEEIQTAPDMLNGYPVQGTGGRNDVFFAVHKDDISKFAVPRLAYGIRWIEDVLDNEAYRGDTHIYPERVNQYRTW